MAKGESHTENNSPTRLAFITESERVGEFYCFAIKHCNGSLCRIFILSPADSAPDSDIERHKCLNIAQTFL